MHKSLSDQAERSIIMFENSGHNPMADEPARFKSLLRQRLTEIAREENI